MILRTIIRKPYHLSIGNITKTFVLAILPLRLCSFATLREIKNYPKVKILSGKSTTNRKNFNHSEPSKTSLIPLPTFTGI
jgi:hypothetical protein